MKFAIVLLACVVAVAHPQPHSVDVRKARAAGDEQFAIAVKQGSDTSPDGNYNYFYETNNGIAVQEQGTPQNLGGNPPVIAEVVQGFYAYTSPEGVPVSIAYTADENGYHPQGDAIPTPPPVPPQILRALEFIAKSAPRN